MSSLFPHQFIPKWRFLHSGKQGYVVLFAMWSPKKAVSSLIFDSSYKWMPVSFHGGVAKLLSVNLTVYLQYLLSTATVNSHQLFVKDYGTFLLGWVV